MTLGCPDAFADLPKTDNRTALLKGLRVIDASVFPALVGGATHAATVMVAEKGADLVKETW